MKLVIRMKLQNTKSEISRKNLISKQAGFTLLEAMVAIAIFTIIMIIGISALLNVNSTNKKSQNQRTIMDNLNFVMEDMARNFKLGSYYHCHGGSDGPIVQGSAPNDFLVIPQDCATSDPISSHSGSLAAAVEPMFDSATGIGIPFEDGYPGLAGKKANAQDQIVYMFDEDDNCILKKSVDGGVSFVPITPFPDIQLDCAASGFNVYNTTSQNFAIAPRILIRITGKTSYKGTITPFSLQTSASQRNVNVIAP